MKYDLTAQAAGRGSGDLEWAERRRAWRRWEGDLSACHGRARRNGRRRWSCLTLSLAGSRAGTRRADLRLAGGQAAEPGLGAPSVGGRPTVWGPPALALPPLWLMTTRAGGGDRLAGGAQGHGGKRVWHAVCEVGRRLD